MDLLSLLENKVDTFHHFRNFLMNQNFADEFFDFFEKNTDATGSENISLWNVHETDSGSVGLQVRVGGDWEDPADILLFINKQKEVWAKVLHEGGGEPRVRHGSPSESNFQRTTEMIAESPINQGAECLGKVDLGDSYELNGEKDN